MELSAQQMATLSRAAAARPQTTSVTTVRNLLPTTVPADRRGAWSAAILCIVATSVLSGGIAYLATMPSKPLHVIENAVVRSASAAQPQLAPSVDTERVKFTNPFDATEIFEFPSNTSETEARQAVAQLLMSRAMERRKAAKITPQRSKAVTADQAEPVRAIHSRPTQLTRTSRLQGASAGGRPSL